MQQRQEARDALDDFPTPMWATRALCERLIRLGYDLRNSVAREPCANRGYMVGPLEEYYARVEASDVHDYGAGFLIEDYLFGPVPARVDWTVMNPPFRLAQQFIARAFESSAGVAVFVRSAFTEGVERWQTLFRTRPPDLILQFSERVVIHKGAMREPGVKYWDPDADAAEGRWKTASSATAYCWLIWLPDPLGETAGTTHFEWIGPARKALQRADDYAALGDMS